MGIAKINIKQAVLPVIVMVILTGALIRFIRLYSGDIDSLSEWDGALRKPVIARLDSLMFGVLGAYCSTYFASRWMKIRVIAFVCGASLLVGDQALSSNSLWRNYASLSVQPFAALCLLPFLSSWTAKSNSLTRIIRFISMISYSLYLVHHSLVQGILLEKYITYAHPTYSSTAIIYGLYWGVGLLLAYMLWRFIEIPFLRLRDRIPLLNPHSLR